MLSPAAAKRDDDEKDEDDEESSGDELEIIEEFETVPRAFAEPKSIKRNKDGKVLEEANADAKDMVYNDPAVAKLMHTDDLSSDDEDGDGDDEHNYDFETFPEASRKSETQDV